MPSPHAIPITLSAADRALPEGWAARRKTAPGFARHARIVLACAARARTAPWRWRCAEHGPDGLLDAPRPGAPCKITAAQVEQAVTTALEAIPADATHSSPRSLARAVGLSRSTVGRLWRAFGLQPHRWETFKPSQDPLLVDKGCALVLTPGEAHETRAFADLLEDLAVGTRCLVGDMGCDADRVRKEPASQDRELDRLRNRIERLVNRRKQFRAVATRYE